MAPRRKRKPDTVTKSATERASTASSRLKRSRRFENPSSSSSNLTQQQKLADATSVGPTILKQISKLNQKCVSVCRPENYEHENDEDSIPSLVGECSELLSIAGASVLLQHAPMVPRALRQAMDTPNVDLVELMKCFTQFASHLAAPNIAGSRDRECPFEKDMFGKHTDMTTAAANWAFLMMSRILGLSGDKILHKCRCKLTTVFVGTRNEVRHCVLERLRDNMHSKLAFVDRKKSLSVDTVEIALKVGPQRFWGTEIVCDVLKKLLSESTTLSKSDCETGLLDNLSEGLIRENGALFDTLPTMIQADVLYASEKVYGWFVRRTKVRITEKSSWEGAVLETKALSLAAQRHPIIHWRLMDGVRKAVGASQKAFRIRWWSSQVWLRATLAQVADRLSAKEIGERVVPEMRTCMRQLAVLVHALKSSGNVEAGVKAAHFIYDTVMTQRLEYRRNEQATLLAFEALMFRALWACGRSMGVHGDRTKAIAQLGVGLVLACNVERAVGGKRVIEEQVLREKQIALRQMLQGQVTVDVVKTEGSAMWAALVLGRTKASTTESWSHEREWSWAVAVTGNKL